LRYLVCLAKQLLVISWIGDHTLSPSPPHHFVSSVLFLPLSLRDFFRQADPPPLYIGPSLPFYPCPFSRLRGYYSRYGSLKPREHVRYSLFSSPTQTPPPPAFLKALPCLKSLRVLCSSPLSCLRIFSFSPSCFRLRDFRSFHFFIGILTLFFFAVMALPRGGPFRSPPFPPSPLMPFSHALFFCDYAAGSLFSRTPLVSSLLYFCLTLSVQFSPSNARR